MRREEALNKAIGILTYNQVNFCKSKEAVANMNKIIEALEKIDQEPCVDVISRQAVLDGLASIAKTKAKSDAQKSLMGRVMFFVKKLPSVTPMQKWIPCSERLPEEHKEVLTCSLGGFIEIQSYEDGCGGYWENQKGDWSDICEVVAWMPLPEPYKPEIPTVAEGSDE